MRDSESGKPLIGADVIILPVTLGKGAATNENGEFLVPNVPAGTYDIKVSYIGYSSEVLKGVTVFPGETKVINFYLKMSPIEGKVVEVVAEARRSIVSVRLPKIQTEIEGEKIKRMPVTDFTEVIANSAGAIEIEAGRSRGLHIRGGRTGEVAVYVDGINTNDPVDRSIGINLDNSAIEQIVISSGGFSAEYGEAMSGAVSIITKEGERDRISGLLEIESDRPSTGINEDLDYGYNKYRFNISGPIPFTKEILTYFISSSYENTRERIPRPIHQKHSSIKSPSATIKLVYKKKNSPDKITIGGSFNDDEYYYYNHSISEGDWLRDYYKGERGHRRLSFKYQSNISKNTAWEFFAFYYNTYRRWSSGEGKDYNDFKYISTRLDWVNYAYENRWYDPRSRKWEPLIGADGNLLIYDSSLVSPDGTPLISLSFEDQAFYYYYAQKNYYDPFTGKWISPEAEAEAMNQRWHDTSYWYIPKDLNPSSMWYDPADSTVKVKFFDRNEYSAYLFLSPDSQEVYDLWGYNGDLHNGWYWDKDIFNLFTYGPGRPWFHNQNTSHIACEFHLMSQVNIYNEVKFGWKFQQSYLNYYDIQFANPKPYFDSYHYEPTVAAGWIENKFEYEDLIIHLGFRYDYFHSHAKALWNPDNFDPGKDGLEDENEPGYDPLLNPDPNNDNYDPSNNPSGTEGDGIVDYRKARPKHQLSPRFGVSFAVSDKSAMYANYGHFFMIPEYGEIYQNIYTDLTSGYPLVGNPDIEPEHTIAYEIGLKHGFSQMLGFEISAYYKDVENLLATRTYNTIFNGQVATVTFQESEDFAKIKGVDFRLKIGLPLINGEITYSYLDAKGTGSSNREFYYLYIDQPERPLPVKEYPLEFDVTHSFKTNLNFYIPMIKKTKNILINMFQDVNINTQININSGAPYTPEDIHSKPMEPGSKRMPSIMRIDLRAEKYIRINNRLFLSVYVDIRNLFNKRNIVMVYPYSGLPDDPGRSPVFEKTRYSRYIGEVDPTNPDNIVDSAEEAYEIHMKLRKQYYNVPGNYGIPRIVRFGISFQF
ncbi:MAG: TonB-dependent receptor [Candidatus Marinimicrobia bacterium]|nr:TonB-dependent receptor [Candidatus Neomarinimicrobiota bacterium]